MCNISSYKYLLSFRSPLCKSSEADDVQKGKLSLPDPVFQSMSTHVVETQHSCLSQALSLNWLATNSLVLFTGAQCSRWSPSTPSCGVKVSVLCWGINIWTGETSCLGKKFPDSVPFAFKLDHHSCPKRCRLSQLGLALDADYVDCRLMWAICELLANLYWVRGGSKTTFPGLLSSLEQQGHSCGLCQQALSLFVVALWLVAGLQPPSTKV